MNSNSSPFNFCANYSCGVTWTCLEIWQCALLSAVGMSAQSTHTDSNAYVSRPTDTSKPELAVSGQAPTANDLLAAYDPARLHPLAGLGDKLDYLLLDDDKKSELPGADTAIPSRGWSDDLCYGTGTMYLGGALVDLFQTTQFAIASSRFGLRLLPALLSSYLSSFCPIISLLIVFCLSHVHPGLASGAVWGLREGARRPLAVSNSRLRINSILNSVTRRGTFIGNSAGVMGVCVLLSLSSLTNSLG